MRVVTVAAIRSDSVMQDSTKLGEKVLVQQLASGLIRFTTTPRLSSPPSHPFQLSQINKSRAKQRESHFPLPKSFAKPPVGGSRLEAQCRITPKAANWASVGFALADPTLGLTMGSIAQVPSASKFQLSD